MNSMNSMNSQNSQKWCDDFYSDTCYFCNKNDKSWNVDSEDAVCMECSKLYKYDSDNECYNKVCIQREVGDVPVEVEVEVEMSDEEFKRQDKKLKKEVLLKLVSTVIDLDDEEFNKLHSIISVFTEDTDCNCLQCDCPIRDEDVECVVCGYDGVC